MINENSEEKMRVQKFLLKNKPPVLITDFDIKNPDSIFTMCQTNIIKKQSAIINTYFFLYSVDNN